MSRQRKPEAAPVAFPEVLRKFWIRSVAAFGLMFLLVWLEQQHANPGARMTPLPDPIFGDLTEYFSTFRLVHTAAFFDSTSLVYPAVAYPPFGAAMFAVLYAFSRPVVAYMALAGLWMALAWLGVRRALLREGVGRVVALMFPVSILVASFPIEGLLQRANVELFLWIFTAMGMWAYLRGRDDAAAILWGLAAAGKFYPVILLVLFLPRKKMRAFGLGVAAFIAATLASAAYFGPTIRVALQGALHNTFGYQGVRVAEWGRHDLGTNHSFFTLLKVVVVALHGSTAHLALPYYACGAVVFAAVFFGRVRKMPVANQLLAVTLFMVMLPTISYFYTLTHLYAPWLVLVFLAVRAAKAGVEIRGLSTTILLFVPVFAAYTLFTFSKIHLWGGVVQGLFLVWLFVWVVRFPFAEPVVEGVAARTI
ncbi:MAG TPA: glycosyltransferase family 87 protein [Acidobacteriaceae bacterium]